MLAFTFAPSQEATPSPTNPCNAITNCFDCITSSNSFNETACFWYRDCSVNDISVPDQCNTPDAYIFCDDDNDNIHFGHDSLTTCIARDNSFAYISIVAFCAILPVLVFLIWYFDSTKEWLMESHIVPVSNTLLISSCVLKHTRAACRYFLWTVRVPPAALACLKC